MPIARTRSLVLVLCAAGLIAAGGCDVRDFGERLAEIEVTTQTSGEAIDPDGYGLLINGSAEQEIGANDVAVFVELEPGTYEVALADVAPNCIVVGGASQEITLSEGQQGELLFEITCTAVGASIVFESERSGNLNVHTIDFRTGIDRQLTTHVAPDYDPAVSPDGTQIAFTSRRDGNLEIYLMNVDGTEQVNLTRNDADDLQPAFSPDGTRIAFVSDRDGGQDLFTMAIDGSDVRNVTGGALEATEPAYLSDNRIVFTGARATRTDLHVVDLSSGDIGPLSSLQVGGGEKMAAVSPDGSRIAFAAYVEENWEIFISDTGGQSALRLTDHPASDLSPAFSPDATRIAFASERDGNFDIYVMRLDGSNVLRVTNHLAFDFKPVFLPRLAP